jgi:hypothetical protein
MLQAGLIPSSNGFISHYFETIYLLSILGTLQVPFYPCQCQLLVSSKNILIYTYLQIPINYESVIKVDIYSFIVILGKFQSLYTDFVHFPWSGFFPARSGIKKQVLETPCFLCLYLSLSFNMLMCFVHNFFCPESFLSSGFTYLILQSTVQILNHPSFPFWACSA